MISSSSSDFSPRTCATLGLLVSGLALPITGLANHLYQTATLGTARHAWMAAHNSLGGVFLAFAIWHVALNRWALASHVRGIVSHLPALRREFVVAALVVGFTTSLAVGHAFLLRR